MAPAAAPVDALLFDLGGVLLGIDFKRAFEAWARGEYIPMTTDRRRLEAAGARRLTLTPAR